MEEVLIVLTVITAFMLMWMAAAIAGVIVIRRTLEQRNRVVPDQPSAAPLHWLWSPLPSARLHRRLQAVGGTAAAASDSTVAHPFVTDPVSLDEVAAQLAYQAVVLDAAVVRATSLPGSEKRRELRDLTHQVKVAESAASRVVEHRRPLGMPASGWAAAAPTSAEALTHLHDRLDRLDGARAELDDIERATLRPEDVLTQVHPELSALPPPPR